MSQLPQKDPVSQTSVPLVFTRLSEKVIEVGVALPMEIAGELSEENLITITKYFVEELAEATVSCQKQSIEHSTN